MTPTISVVIPAFEDPFRLGFVLEGLARQCDPVKHEVIVADAGRISVEDLVMEYRSRLNLKYCSLPEPAPNRTGKTRNWGFAHAKAPRILILDQDCIPAFGIVEEHAKYDDDPVLVAGFRNFLYAEELQRLTLDQVYECNNRCYASDARHPWIRGDERIKLGCRLIYIRDIGCSCHMSFPAVLARKIGGFLEEMTEWGGDDLEFCQRLCRAGCFLVIRADLTVVHLDHPIQPRRSENARQREETDKTTRMVREKPILRAYDPTKEILHSWGRESEGLAVISMATEVGGYVDFFLQSCDRHRIRPIVLGQGSQWRGWGTKLNLLYYYLTEVEFPPYVLWVDGYDMVFQSTLREIWQTFKTFGSLIVFCAEHLCWPDESLLHRYPSSPTARRYVNGGGFIGETKAILRMLEHVGCPLENEAVNDQGLFTRYFLSHSREIKLDYEARIFHCLFRAENTAKFVSEAKCYVNSTSGHKPHILHLNGGEVDSTPYANNLGYDIVNYKRRPPSITGL
jgi:hypothetical protein